jgi:3-isopropylmalate/(R)-2-methylmalate dehydratase small subunit
MNPFTQLNARAVVLPVNDIDTDQIIPARFLKVTDKAGYGFRAVISTEFADIFRNNSLKNGLLPILVTAEQYQMVLAALKDAPDRPISIDLAAQRVILPNEESFTFPIDEFSKTCLLQGVDQLGYILNMEDKITAYEQAAVL